MARGTGEDGCGAAAPRGSSGGAPRALKPGQLFVHTRWLDPTFEPGPGQLHYADAPNAVCRITAVRRGVVYFKIGAEQGKGDFWIDAEKFVERDVKAWVAADGTVTPVSEGLSGDDRPLAPVPSASYELSQWYGSGIRGDEEPKHRYLDAEGAAMQARIDESDPDTLHLILGDMAYHDISLSQTRFDGARKTAELYDETGAVEDIEQLLEAAVRLLPANTRPIIPGENDDRIVNCKDCGGGAAVIDLDIDGRCPSCAAEHESTSYVLGRPVTIKRGRGFEYRDSTTSERAYCTEYLPDIAASADLIARHADAPLLLRLDYQRYRSEALAATDTPAFAEKAMAANLALDKVRGAIAAAREQDAPATKTDEFIEHGDHYRVETIYLDDGQLVQVTIATDSEPPEVDRFSGSFAENEAVAFIAGRIEATDPDRPPLEERLAPFGEEWEREQDERRGGTGPIDPRNDGSHIF